MLGDLSPTCSKRTASSSCQSSLLYEIFDDNRATSCSNGPRALTGIACEMHIATIFDI